MQIYRAEKQSKFKAKTKKKEKLSKQPNQTE